MTNRYHGPFELFDGHAYAKGGMILHALRRELGDAAYRKAVTAHVTGHAGQSVDTHQFEDLIERVTGRDVSRFFAQWIHGAGQPEIEARWTYEDGTCRVHEGYAQRAQVRYTADARDRTLLAIGLMDDREAAADGRLTKDGQGGSIASYFHQPYTPKRKERGDNA